MELLCFMFAKYFARDTEAQMQQRLERAKCIRCRGKNLQRIINRKEKGAWRAAINRQWEAVKFEMP